MDTAKVFMSGRSQAVRLPKKYRFDTDEVCVKRVGSVIMLFPKDKAWDVMAETLGQVDDDFMAERNQPAKAEERAPL